MGTSSSLEVLASLALNPKDHDQLLTAADDDSNLPEFYLKYVDEIIRRIEENCRDEFNVIWQASQAGQKKMDASKALSKEITSLQDHIAEADLGGDLIREVLGHAIPQLLVEKCGIDALIERLPSAYVKATAAFWLASKYVYEHGVQGSNSFAFHRFMLKFSSAAVVDRSTNCSTAASGASTPSAA